jgi:hypothetical protein
MTDEEFTQGLIGLNLDARQLQVARSRVPTARHLRTIFGEGTSEWPDEKIEAYTAAARKAIFDEYRQRGEQWENMMRGLDQK